ncbi:hypothetical protein CA11_28770 [Gimesia maris]|nr:hypothetical protein CA11_28770 [Gimesia maris]
MTDEQFYRPKWEIVLKQYDRVITHWIEFEWPKIDEGYCSKVFFEGFERAWPEVCNGGP